MGDYIHYTGDVYFVEQVDEKTVVCHNKFNNQKFHMSVEEFYEEVELDGNVKVLKFRKMSE